MFPIAIWDQGILNICLIYEDELGECKRDKRCVLVTPPISVLDDVTSCKCSRGG